MLMISWAPALKTKKHNKSGMGGALEERLQPKGLPSRKPRESVPWPFFLALVLAQTAPWAYAEEAIAREISFDLYAPQAKSVEVFGDFNQWQSGEMPLAGPDETGMWRLKLSLPVTLTRIEYVYWVDGARSTDPEQAVVQDGFSGKNNVRVFP